MYSNPDQTKHKADLEQLLEVSERKADILTNLLKEAAAEYDQRLEQIKVSEANFRAVFENAPEAIYILDADNRRILDCNPFMLHWLGYARSEMLDLCIEDILAPGADNIHANIQQAMERGVVRIQERRFQKKNSRTVVAEVTGTVVDYEGKSCFLAMVRDITERKKIEELHRYKELFDNVSDPVFINDDMGHFLEVNDVACECLGYTRQCFMKMTLRDITSPVHYPILMEIGKKIRRGETFCFEISLMHRQSVEIPFEFQGRLIHYQMKPAFLSVARNLSIRKHLEQSLIKTERLSAVGEMASGVAHNFNNLLQMIIAGAETALIKLKDGKIRESRQAIENILSASFRGADVVRRIKDFTLLGLEGVGGGGSFDLEELISEAVELTRPLWKPPSNPQKYRLNFLKQTPCRVNGNSSEIYEVLVNLIKNALESMAGGGSLTISTQQSDGYAYLIVADTGCGIPADQLQRIFEPFFTTKGSQNSGLGLSSCYGIVKRHQGDIQVKSLSNVGSEFTVRLPLAKPCPAPNNAAFHLVEETPIRLLLIDDEAHILTSFEHYFEDTPIEMTAVHSGQEALRVIHENRFDVVLCDLSMDDMNGLEVGRAVSSHCRRSGDSKIPFLLYTGLGHCFDNRQLEDAGVDLVVTKPTSCAELTRIIQNVVKERRQLEVTA